MFSRIIEFGLVVTLSQDIIAINLELLVKVYVHHTSINDKISSKSAIIIA